MRTYIPGDICPHYVRTTSHEVYFSRWPRTHAVRVTGHEAKQWPGVAKAAFPGCFLHPLLPVDHNPSSLRFLAVTLTACVFGHLEKTYIPLRCCADIVRTYISNYQFRLLYSITSLVARSEFIFYKRQDRGCSSEL